MPGRSCCLTGGGPALLLLALAAGALSSSPSFFANASASSSSTSFSAAAESWRRSRPRGLSSSPDRRSEGGGGGGGGLRRLVRGEALGQRERRNGRRLQMDDSQQMDGGMTMAPSASPTTPEPTVSPAPSAPPTESFAPSEPPSFSPSSSPTAVPSGAPSAAPSSAPSSNPTASHAPSASPRPTAVEFDQQVVETRADGSERLRYSCSRSDLPPDPNGGENGLLRTTGLSFQYGVLLKHDGHGANPQGAANQMEVQIHKELAWRYLFCDYQTEFANQGFYVHSIDSYLPDAVEPSAVDDGGGCAAGGGGGASPSNTTGCYTVTSRFQMQLVLADDEAAAAGGGGGSRRGRGLEGSSGPDASVWGLDPRVVQSVGNFLTGLLASERTWRDVPQVESAQFRGFVNPSADAPGSGGGSPGGSAAASSSSASERTDTLLAVLPWVAIALAVVVLALALFLILRRRPGACCPRQGKKKQGRDGSDRNNTSSHRDETDDMGDSYLAAGRGSASAGTRASPSSANESPRSPYLQDDEGGDDGSLVSSALHDGRLMMTDDSTIGRSELGYSVVDDSMDYSVRELGPALSFDSQLTDTNVSLLFAGDIGEAGIEDDAAAPSARPRNGDVLVPPPAEESAAAASPAAASDPAPAAAAPTRLINANLALRAPHVVSARNRSAKDPGQRPTSPPSNEKTARL